MAITNAFDVQNLVFSWQPNAPAILDIPSLTIAQGSALFVQGDSGSGKSTLLNILSGVLRPQQGDVRLLGQAFSQLSPSRRDQLRADHIGYIFQQFNLLPYLSVLDNVLLPVKVSALRRRGQSANAAGLVEEAQHWLQQLNVPARLYKEKVTRLSVGQQQRVAAARALIGRPEIIIADEPTSALDQANADNFMQRLVEQCQRINSTLVFVSHDQRLAPFFQSTYQLSAHSSAETEAS